MSTLNSTNTGSYPDDPDTEQGLLPELNGVDLVMSLSPKTNQHLQHLQTLQHNSLHNINNHSTPFSVSDILSPIEEYRKLELNPPSPYRYDCQSVRCESLMQQIFHSNLTFAPLKFSRSNSSGSSVNSPSALGSNIANNMANPYAMGPLYHSPGVQSYCTPSDNLSLAGHYTDMRNSASWYGSTANDPRFASELNFFCNVLKAVKDGWKLDMIWVAIESKMEKRSEISWNNRYICWLYQLNLFNFDFFPPIHVSLVNLFAILSLAEDSVSRGIYRSGEKSKENEKALKNKAQSILWNKPTE